MAALCSALLSTENYVVEWDFVGWTTMHKPLGVSVMKVWEALTAQSSSATWGAV